MKQVLMTLAAAGVLAAGFAFAQTTTTTPQTGAARHPGVRAMVHKRMMKQLNLTPDQQQQAKSIFQAARQSVQPQTQQLKTDRQALHAAVQAGDNAKIQQLTAEMGTLRGNVMAARAQAQSKFFALLTPDQRTKAEQFQQKARQVLGNRKAGN